MPKKKNTKLNNSKRKTKKNKPGLKNNLFKIGIGFFALIFLLVAAGAMLRYLIPKRTPKLKPASAPTEKIIPPKIPAYEIYPEEKIVAPEPVPIPKPIPKIPAPSLPEIAIIIDDIGYDKDVTEKLIRLNSSLTFSVLPYGTFSQKAAKLATDKGYEIMLHLPMEPVEYPGVDPGPGALLTDMAPDELIRQLETDLNLIPYVKGINNHMGSKMTASSDQINQIFSILKKRGLYFIDSKTTNRSVCKPSAQMFKVPYSERDVFIDHKQDREFIKNQIELLIHIAEKHGASIGIAHHHEITYEVLSDMLPELKKRANIVPVSKLLKRAG